MKNSVLVLVTAVLLCAAGLHESTYACSSSTDPTCPSPSGKFTWSDTVSFLDQSSSPDGLWFDSSSDPAVATFDISAQFEPGVDSLSSIKFFIEILDDYGCNDRYEKLKLEVGSWTYKTGDIDDRYGWDWSTKSSSGGLLAELADDGLLSLTIKHKEGDFWLQSAMIEATGCDYPSPPPPVPEPSTVLLLGAGILGLAAYGRKRIKK